MNVHYAFRGDFQDFLAQYPSVRDGDHDVWREAAEECDYRRIAKVFGLVYGQAQLFGDKFDGRRSNAPSPSGRAVGLGYHGRDLLARRDQAPERWYSESGGPDEHQRHQSQHTLKPQGAL